MREGGIGDFYVLGMLKSVLWGGPAKTPCLAFGKIGTLKKEAKIQENRGVDRVFDRGSDTNIKQLWWKLLKINLFKSGGMYA